MADNASPTPKTFAELLKADLQLKADKKIRDKKDQKLEFLYEAKRTIELEIEEAETSHEAAKAVVRQKQIDELARITASGLSAELMKAYEAFCESLYEPDGLYHGRQPLDGFSILCDQPHNGSYFDYDPEFRLFKEFVEPQSNLDLIMESDAELGLQIELELELELELESESETASETEMGDKIASEKDSESDSEMEMERSSQKNLYDGGYNNRNFRCEASVSAVRWLGGSETREHIVEFWPLHRIEPRSGVEVTWGEQYVSYLPSLYSSVPSKRNKERIANMSAQPELYRLAIQAAKNGSEAAMEMLIRLPDMNAVFSGWLLEYEFAEELKDELLLSRRWVFKQARKIDGPGTVEEKRESLERLIAAY
jgi:hypothetical protein